MHMQWDNLTPEDHEKFFKIQHFFSREIFEPNKVKLAAVDVDFYPGYKLVYAEIEPQTVQLLGGKSLTLEEKYRSFFLYNPGAKQEWRKLVPLMPEAQSIYAANKLLDLKLTKENVIDYVKYFGLVDRDKRGMAYVIDHRDEIPWTEDADEEARCIFTGELSARSPLKEDGHYEVGLKETRLLKLLPPFIIKIFTMRIPVVHSNAPYAATIRVAQTGEIDMDDGQKIESDAIRTFKRSLPFYPLEPTADLAKKQDKERAATARLANIRGFFIESPFQLLFLANIIAMGIGVVDVVVGHLLPDLSKGVNAWALDQNWVLIGLAMAGLVGLFFQIFRLANSLLLDYYAVRVPGRAMERVRARRHGLREKYPSRFSRGWHSFWIVFFGIIFVVLAWSLIFYALDGLGVHVYVYPDGEHSITLRGAILYGVSSVPDWFFHGGNPFGFVTKIRALNGVPQDLHLVGTRMEGPVLFFGCVAILAQVTRFWRLSSPKKNKENGVTQSASK